MLFFKSIYQNAMLTLYLFSVCFKNISAFIWTFVQVFQPWVQKRRLEYIKHRHVMSGVLKHLKMRALGRLCTDDGRPNEEVLTK